ncbi:MAG: enoyl-CoA hydratase-related protein, partial [Pseudomonadota bacterium]
MGYETVCVEIEEHVGTIRLDRPDALNALNAQLLEELGKALQSMDRNDKVRVIILTGSEKAFAAGADIKEMAEKSFVDMYGSDYFTPEVEKILRVRKPIIAAVS